jgi:sulfite reductase alpha subunit-like flavoprotein
MMDRRIVCVYGSVTGKAESIAEQLVDSAKSNGIQMELFSVS